MIFKRLLLYLLFPAGIVLLFLPVPTHRREDVRREVLFLQILETMQTKAPNPAAEPAPSDSPAMQDVLDTLNEQRRQLSETNRDDASAENSLGSPIVGDRDLARYPALREKIGYLKRLAQFSERKEYGPTRAEDVPHQEWVSFKEAILNGADPAGFQHGAAVFEGHTDIVGVSEPVAISGLDTGRRVVGGVLIVSGLLLMLSLFRSRNKGNGVQIGRRGAILLWDIIVIGVGIVFIWWCLDIAMASLFQAEAFWGDDPIKMMGVPWIVVVIPIMALFVSATASQRIAITNERISLQGLFGEQTIAWSDVEGIRVSELYTPWASGENVGPKKAGKMLMICGGNTTLQVMEPPLASTKREILDKLARCAPESLQSRVSESASQWTSIW